MIYITFQSRSGKLYLGLLSKHVLCALRPLFKVIPPIMFLTIKMVSNTIILGVLAMFAVTQKSCSCCSSIGEFLPRNSMPKTNGNLCNLGHHAVHEVTLAFVNSRKAQSMNTGVMFATKVCTGLSWSSMTCLTSSILAASQLGQMS